MVGHNLPHLIEIGLTYISENLDEAVALPALPLITPLPFFSISLFVILQAFKTKS